MAEQQTDGDLEFIDSSIDTPDERRAEILAKLRESPEDYQRYEAYLEILDVPVARKKDPPVHIHNHLLAAANPTHRRAKADTRPGLVFVVDPSCFGRGRRFVWRVFPWTRIHEPRAWQAC